MEPNTNEATAPKRLKSGGKKPLIIIGIVLAVLAVLAGAAYLACCYLGTYSDTFAPRYTINGVNVGGLTVEQASEKIWEEYQQRTVSVYLSTEEDPIDFAFGLNTASDLEKQGLEPALEIPVSELGVTLSEDYAGGVHGSFIISHGRGFFVNGWNYLRCLLLGGSRVSTGIEGNRMQFWERADAAAAELSRETIDAAYELGEDSLTVTVPRDGRRVDSQAMRQALELARGEFDADYRAVVVEAETLPAKTLTAREIYDECSGTVQNASYDAETETIVPEQAGADFDVDEAQQLLDAAEPGGTVTVPAQVELPAVTAEELEQVLFRDVLGEARTHVGGTSARRSNVKLSAAAINGYVMNTGDVFSYNGVVGQRTAANGYQAAPAYVKGETVDEIGGGICQTSSTLYLACLRSNLAITERYAHRYVPAYITAGMDATVSWGGPDYKFTNDTLYPIKIVTKYENNYLTVQVLGTNVDGTSVKMTNEWLSTTPYETVYEDDPTLAPGTEQIKTSPYTGYKYRTYRNVYDADGKLISSTYEATSDYKARNKVILRGPVIDVPAGGETELPVDPGDPTAPTEPTEPTDPAPPAGPGEPDEGRTIQGAGGEQTPTDQTGAGTAGEDLPADVRPEDAPFL